MTLADLFLIKEWDTHTEICTLLQTGEMLSSSVIPRKFVFPEGGWYSLHSDLRKMLESTTHLNAPVLPISSCICFEL